MEYIKLSDISTRAPEDLNKKIRQKTGKILEELDKLQNLLYAEFRHSFLIVIQGVDASGKDGTIRHVFSHLNPQGNGAIV
jgi:polyphosphate kinase 2 (PPK2 family)